MNKIEDPNASAVTAMKTPEYRVMRSTTNWEARQGREQTAFFARAALAALPDWLKRDIAARQLPIYDFGCALGDALPILKGAFPQCAVSGGDVSHAAISRARELHHGFGFDVLSADNAPPERAIHYCSNTLQHFKDWRRKLDALAAAARDYVIIVVPFAEVDLIEEHEVAFHYSSLPLNTGPHRLVYLTSYDTSRAPDTHWPGRQMAAVYARNVDGAAQQITTLARDQVILDFRGIDAATVAATLTTAEAFDAAMALEVATHERLKARAALLCDEREHFQTLYAETKTYQDELVGCLTQAREDLRQTQIVLERLAESSSLHNAELTRREAELGAEFRATRAILGKLLQSRSWRLLSRGHEALARVRRQAYQPLSLPVLPNLSLPRLDLSPLLDSPTPVRRGVVSRQDSRAVDPAAANKDAPRALLTVDSLHRGGVEQVVVDLAHGLTELGYCVGVAVANDGGDCADVLLSAGVDVRILRHNHAALASFVTEFRPAFAIANHCYFGFDHIKSQGVPILDVIHNYYVWHQAAPEQFRRLSAAAARSVAVSTGVADYHSRTFAVPRNQIAVINNPINRQGLLRPEPALLKRIRNAQRPHFTFVNTAQFFPPKRTRY